jgi:hypothetical protein
MDLKASLTLERSALAMARALRVLCNPFFLTLNFLIAVIQTYKSAEKDLKIKYIA